jgi:hypothetical protein
VRETAGGVGEGDDFYCCIDCWEGSGLIPPWRRLEVRKRERDAWRWCLLSTRVRIHVNKPCVTTGVQCFLFEVSSSNMYCTHRFVSIPASSPRKSFHPISHDIADASCRTLSPSSATDSIYAEDLCWN